MEVWSVSVWSTAFFLAYGKIASNYSVQFNSKTKTCIGKCLIFLGH